MIVGQWALFSAGIWCVVAFFAANDMLTDGREMGGRGAMLLLMAAMMRMSLMPVKKADRVIGETERIELLLAKRG